MDEINKNSSSKQNSLKVFFIKLISISIVVIIVINLVFNLIFAERLEKIDKILLLNNNHDRQDVKEKIRDELEEALNKENMLYEEDKILLYKLYRKIKKEFENLDKNKI